MWQPEPGWHPLPAGAGTSTVGVWRAAIGGRPVAIKRLAAPGPGDEAELSDPGHPAYWRREADVLDTGLLAGTPGIRAVAAGIVEDAEGITITREWVEDAALSGLFIAAALARFAAAPLPRPRFLCGGLLRKRLAAVGHRGGWTTLARTTAADIAEQLWADREQLLDVADALPQVPMHGDPTTTNLPGRDGDDAVAIDLATVGSGPVGADLGYYSLSSREEFEPLLDAYLMALPEGVAAADDVLLGARITAVYTALTRADWALARVAGGEGALAGKYRHPSVAPYLRALQRQSPHVEALLGW
jgi:hypothetical protein